MKLSIKWKISLALLALILCVSGNFFGIRLWIDDSKAYGTIINLAGRQRMLSQKVTKEAMFIVNGFDVGEDLEKTKQLFEQTLNGLIYGDEKLGLPPANVKEIRDQLLKVKGLWGELEKDIDTASSGALYLVSKKRALYDSSLEVLREMDIGVKMLEEDSSKALARLWTNATLTFIVSIFIAAAGFYFIEKNVISKLRETVGAAEHLKGGDLSARVKISSQDEIGKLGIVFNEMAGALEKRQEQEKTFQRKLQEETVLAQSKERRIIAQDIHDHIGHSLAMLRMKIEDAQVEAADGSDKIKASLDESMKLIKEMIQQTRTLIFDLYPIMLDDLGIMKTIKWHVREFNSKTGLNAEFIEEGTPVEPSRSVSIYLLKAVKELLNNVLKYAHADEIVVKAQGLDSIFRISVIDNGKGFESRSVLKSTEDMLGVGLFTIREWVSGMDGEFLIESSPGNGTIVTIEIPVS